MANKLFLMKQVFKPGWGFILSNNGWKQIVPVVLRETKMLRTSLGLYVFRAVIVLDRINNSTRVCFSFGCELLWNDWSLWTVQSVYLCTFPLVISCHRYTPQPTPPPSHPRISVLLKTHSVSLPQCHTHSLSLHTHTHNTKQNAINSFILAWASLREQFLLIADPKWKIRPTRESKSGGRGWLWACGKTEWMGRMTDGGRIEEWRRAAGMRRAGEEWTSSEEMWALTIYWHHLSHWCRRGISVGQRNILMTLCSAHTNICPSGCSNLKATWLKMQFHRCYIAVFLR